MRMVCDQEKPPMRFLRLLLVVTLVTLLGGLFGAGVGSLVGYAVPSSFHAGYGAGTPSETVALPAPAQDPALKSAGVAAPAAQSPHVNVGFQFRSTHAGAALGAAWGLVMGAIIGLILGIIDQVILAIRSIVSLRQAKSTPVSAGNTP